MTKRTAAHATQGGIASRTWTALCCLGFFLGSLSLACSDSSDSLDAAEGSGAAGKIASSRSGEVPDGAIVFREHEVKDPGMNDTVISTLLIPEGWSVEGGATRPNNMLFNMPVLIDLSVRAPDGRNIRFFPALAFEFNNQPGAYGPSVPKKLQPLQSGNVYYPFPESPGSWVVDFASLNPAPGVTNLHLVSEEDIPEMTATLQQQNAFRYQMAEQMNQTTASMGFGSEFDTQATKIVIEYDKGAQTIEETIVMTWIYEVMISQGQVTQGTWNVLTMQSMGGPKGSDYLSDPAMNAIFQSARTNPVWVAEMNKYWTELANIKHKGNMAAIKSAAKISEIQSQSASDVNEIMMQGWRSRNASSDRMQAKTVDAITDQTAYVTPDGDAVKLPSFYENVHTDGNGRYLLHHDANYEPNRDAALNGSHWQRIEEQR